MKTLTFVTTLCLVCSFAQGAQIMEDGFEAADTLAGNGWTGAWNLSTSGYGNPANYAWSAGDNGAISKDTGYAIQSGDYFDLIFDFRDMDVMDSTNALVATLFYNNGVSNVVLGTASILDGDYQDQVWEDITLPNVASTAESIGHNLLVGFDYTYGPLPRSRLGVDNVTINTVPAPPSDGLSNGDFEATPFDSGWDNTGSVAVSGLTGSGTAAELGTGDVMSQDFIHSAAGGPTSYQVDFMWSLADLAGAQRARMQDAGGVNIISLKMDDAGLYKYSNTAGGWTNAVPGTYSVDVPYYIRVTVFEGDTVAEYNVGVSTDGINYTTSSDFDAFHLAAGNLPFEIIRFEGGSGSGMTIDEVSVDDGTGPDAYPVTVAISILDATSAEISWGATNGLFYTVEANINLLSGPAGWNSVTSNIPGINGELSITNSIGNDQRFYRVVTEE